LLELAVAVREGGGLLLLLLLLLLLDEAAGAETNSKPDQIPPLGWQGLANVDCATE
jgi:hypothetical protein